MELVGAVMLCSAFFFLGTIASISEKQSCDRLQSLHRLVSSLRSMISSTRRPLGSFFASYSDKVLSECGFLAVMNNPNTTKSYTDRWEIAVKQLMLDGEAEKVALTVGRELGRLDLKTQTEQLIFLEKSLEDILKEQRRTLEGKQKIYKSVSLLAGVVITILLI